MPTINARSGVQFRADLISRNTTDKTAWLEAVGKELERKGVSLKLGEGASAKTVNNAQTLIAAMKELPAGEYVNELTEALDDLAGADSVTTSGDVFDFTKGSKLSAALGVGDGVEKNYAVALKAAGGAQSIDGVTAQLWKSADGVDLSAVPHMSAEALRGAPVAYGRDGEEVEDTRVITGLSTAETVKLATDALGDLQRPKAAAGLTLGMTPLDEMAWDSDSHALRRANPYVSFSLDQRSYELNPNNGKPRVGVGRDFFFDTFLAKKDPRTGELNKDLQKAELMYRTRIRYGSDRDPFDGTRVLIGMKQGTAIVDGVKHAAKIDSRTDSANQAIFDTLTESAQTGKLSSAWGSGSNVAPAAASMYRVAVQKGVTDNVGGETNVLALAPGAVARQIRGRFHLNETPRASVLDGFQKAGEPRIAELKTLLEKAPDFSERAGLLAQANGLLDRSAIVAAASEKLKAIDPNITVDKALIDRLWPGATISNKQDAKLQRAVVDAIRTTYDGFAEGIDAAQRKIGGNEDRKVRDAGSASDVMEFFRTRAAVARFMAHAERNGATKGNAASYVEVAKKVAEMPDGKPKTDLLQQIGVGLNQVREMTEASFASTVAVKPELAKKQTVEGFIAEFDAQLAGPNKDAFLKDLGAFLATKNSGALAAATAEGSVAADLRKNLVTAHAEVLHRMVEGAAGWAQGVWFNDYRQAALGINAQGWNFIIGSMDYTEFYDASTGQGLSFQDRVSRRPLDASKMTGAMISNDIQIELEAEEGYTRAIRTAQYGVNAKTAGVLMDYALSVNASGVTAGDAASFEKWFATQLGQRPMQRDAFIADVTAFAKGKGSPIDLAGALPALEAQEKAITVLTAFAQKKDATLTTREAVQTWIRAKGNLSEAERNDFLTEVAQFASESKSDIPLSPNLLQTLEFSPFAAANAGKPYSEHAAVVDSLSIANEVWTMVKQAQKDLSTARGQEVERVLRDNNLRGKGWEPPTGAKGDYAINLAIR
ncbi:MAG: hypothetical protein JNM17_31660 [Archangium sp.]|nr:hypothetical protein [Archangium sp.]